MDSTQAEMLMASLEGKIVGGWQINGRFGYGKSAVVMNASKNGQVAALKIFHPELIERYGEAVQLERIARERRLIGVEHSNLVQIYDGGKCEETKYLFVTMEAVPYKSLREVVQEISLPQIRPIIIQLAHAAMFLEEQGLAHRDIKPENIAITDDLQHIKLLDLGVLRPFGEADLTDIDHRTFIGTLRYSSPEFLQRKEEDSIEGWRAVTLYQIGAVLHDLLMKKEIFSEYSSPYSVLVKAVLDETPQVFAGDAALVRLCKHCLIKNPNTRRELVSWRDFERSDRSSDATDSMLGLIKDRQKYYQDLTKKETLGTGETERLAKKQIEELCNRFCARIGIVLNELTCFPLRKIDSEFLEKSPSCEVLVHFEKDQNKGLPVHLALSFHIELFDANNEKPIYTVTTCVAISDSELRLEQLNQKKKFLMGEAEELMSNTHFESHFLAALTCVYEYLETSEHVNLDGVKILSIQSE